MTKDRIKAKWRAEIMRQFHRQLLYGIKSDYIVPAEENDQFNEALLELRAETAAKLAAINGEEE